MRAFPDKHTMKHDIDTVLALNTTIGSNFPLLLEKKKISTLPKPLEGVVLEASYGPAIMSWHEVQRNKDINIQKEFHAWTPSSV